MDYCLVDDIGGWVLDGCVDGCVFYVCLVGMCLGFDVWIMYVLVKDCFYVIVFFVEGFCIFYVSVYVGKFFKVGIYKFLGFIVGDVEIVC